MLATKLDAHGKASVWTLC